ncbi:unnamed protein product [Hymenolepis diminuta]|uniref:Uncharacterized protein n=1 Tax=Hymenolepis diminuta TaxID=6216 RepID=A0A564Z282_HYMDI|nr:unnamed protein product [Hymenolepis diminuta]
MAEKIGDKLCDYGSSMDESGDESRSGIAIETLNDKVETPKNSSSHESDDQKSSKEDTGRVESKAPRQYRKASRSSSRERSLSKRYVELFKTYLLLFLLFVVTCKSEYIHCFLLLSDTLLLFQIANNPSI